MIELAKQMKMESAGMARAETIGGVFLMKASDELKANIGKKRVTTVGGMLKVKAGKQISLTGTEKVTMKSVIQKLEASKSITFEVGSTTLTMKDGVIEIITPKVSLTVSGNNNLGAEESHQN